MWSVANLRIAQRYVTLKHAISPEHDSDILEELSKGGATHLPRNSGTSDVSAGLKRRRDEDEDEDGLLERLSQLKQQMPDSSSPQADSESPASPLKGGGEDGGRRSSSSKSR